MFGRHWRGFGEWDFGGRAFGGRGEDGGFWGSGTWGPGSWGHGRWGRHGGGRMFQQGDLRYVILSLIAERPRHGYELIKELEDRSGGLYAPSPGAIYPILTLLEEQGFATATPEAGGKKLYAITDEGRAVLAQNQVQVDAIFARIEMMGRAGRAAAPPKDLIQAMGLLKQALALRIGRAPWSAEEIAKVRTIIERAAGDVTQV